MASAKELTAALSLAVLALLLGAIFGHTGWFLFACSLIWIWVQTVEFRKVRKWTQRPLRKPRNGSETWFPLAYQPFRALVRERQRSQAMAQRLRQIMSLSDFFPDAVIILDVDGNIEDLNSAAKNLLQLSESDLGLSLASIVRSPDFVDFLRQGAADESLEFVSPANAEITLEARRFAGDSMRIIVLVRDITALNRLLTMRQSFIANASHELRTPLTVVNGYIEMLNDDEHGDAEKLALLPKLDSPMRRMKSLVDDLLLLTQLESTQISDQRQAVNLARLIQESVADLTPTMANDGQVKIRIESELYVAGIEAELQSVISNLLSNAIRYSPNGEPIEIYTSAHANRVRLGVKDQGVGIGMEHLGRLTERFYRADMAGSRVKGGTGLGLAIVKHVLLRHDSRLQVTSKLQQGSHFFCDLPIAENQPVLSTVKPD